MKLILNELLLYILYKLVYLILFKFYNFYEVSYSNFYFVGKNLRFREVREILELRFEFSFN